MKKPETNNKLRLHMGRRKIIIETEVTPPPSKKEGLKKNHLVLKRVKPKTSAQQRIFDSFYEQDKHLVLHGYAGTGKTFLSLYLALSELEKNQAYDRVVIVRSVVATRDIGFLPGSVKEKIEIFEQPYKQICSELFGRGDAYEMLKTQKKIEFLTTSFMRGLTVSNAIVIVDEINNMNFQELDTVITRLGENAKLILCGDYRQSDLRFADEREGLGMFLKVLKTIPEHFDHIELCEDDIVRSGLVKSYIIAKDHLRID